MFTEYKPAVLMFIVAVPCPDVIPGPDQTIVFVEVLGKTERIALPDIQSGAVIVGDIKAPCPTTVYELVTE